MSLRLWLPLRGDLTNNGLDQAIITQSNCTIDTEGKIGSCYSFNGSSSYIEIVDSNFPTILSGDFSMCLWVYNNDDAGRSIFFGNYQLTSGFYLSIEKYENNNARFYWNNSPNIDLGPASISVSSWTHLCVTRKGNTVKCYINGELKKTSTTTLNNNPDSTVTTFRLGRDSRTGATAFSGKLNDFRLYDHELSAKEVKEISQALIQHFPLNDFVGNENLLLDTMKDFGQSHNVYEIATFNFSKALVEGNTYTVTCKINMSEEKKSFGIWHTGNTGSYRCGEWQNRNSSGIYTWTFTANSYMTSQTSGAGYGYARVYVSNNEGTAQGSTTVTGTANVEWIKIEEGSVSTPYLPNPADAAYNKLGFNSTTVFDTSGYCNNGTLSTNKPTLALGSPRYSSCMSFNGTDTFIACGKGGMVKDAITINVWAYMDDWSSLSDNRIIVSCTQSGGWELYYISNANKFRFDVGTGVSSNTYKYLPTSQTPSDLSGWVMFTASYDGYIAKIYVNGVLSGTLDAYSTKTPLYYVNNGLFIGAEAGGNANTPASQGYYFNGKLSDFRIYATALSDADILELYNSPISIDNTGKVHALEFREV